MISKNKKIVFLILLVILVFGAGFFWWRQAREIKGNPDDYVIKETEQGKIVENKRAGLTVSVPQGWEAEKIELEEGAVNFYSQDAEIELREGKIVLPIKSGCFVQFNIVYKEMNFEQIKEEAKYSHIMMGPKSDEFEEIVVNNYKALKNSFDTRNFGSGIGIYIPVRNKGYAFYLRWGPEEKEKCVQEFNSFLETIEIE